MFRTSDIVLITVMVAAAAFTYKIKHDAEDRSDQIRKIEAAIRTEQDTITILRADWSLLTQPARLQRLTDVYQAELSLTPVDPHQYVDLKDIPEKPPVPEDVIAQEIEAAAGKDKTVTGAIKP